MLLHKFLSAISSSNEQDYISTWMFLDVVRDIVNYPFKSYPAIFSSSVSVKFCFWYPLDILLFDIKQSLFWNRRFSSSNRRLKFHFVHWSLVNNLGQWFDFWVVLFENVVLKIRLIPSSNRNSRLVHLDIIFLVSLSIAKRRREFRVFFGCSNQVDIGNAFI